MNLLKNKYKLTTLLLLFLLNSLLAHKINNYPITNSPVKTGKAIKTVVIDAGHGGKDSGCLGVHSKEKEVALSIALKLGKMIEENFPDVKVVYTRKTDVFIELHNRARIANKANADLFISIHCNASTNKAAYGSETYVMGLHKTEANLEVAKRENSVILFEENYEAQYEGFDINTPEGSILFSLYQNTFLNQSLNFATKVQQQFKSKAQRYDRGVKQAGFLVLVKTGMPSVLIETGFLTNIEEEKFLADEKNQELMSEAIFKAFIDYKYDIDGSKPIEKKSEFQKNSTQNIEQPQHKEEDNNTDTPHVFFAVQVAANTSKINIQSSDFKKLSNLKERYHNGWYRYTVGEETDLEKAKKIQLEVREIGFKDAFVVAFRGEEKIGIQEALDFLSKNK